MVRFCKINFSVKCLVQTVFSVFFYSDSNSNGFVMMKCKKTPLIPDILLSHCRDLNFNNLKVFPKAISALPKLKEL